jgi:hypothetical protein
MRALAGSRFGRLIVLSAVLDKGRHSVWLCECDCGATRNIREDSLDTGNTRSCGCLQKDAVSKATRKHGASTTKSHKAWRAMLDRCYNHKHKSYDIYGGRGIKVCDEWRQEYSSFLSDMGEPQPRMFLDRVNNDLGYSKDNCRWATGAESVRNRSNTFIIEWEGKQCRLVDVAESMGIKPVRAYKRIVHSKWDTCKALTEPVRKWIKKTL